MLMNSTRTLGLLVAAFFTMAFTLPGCPDVDALNQKMGELEKKSWSRPFAPFGASTGG